MFSERAKNLLALCDTFRLSIGGPSADRFPSPTALLVIDGELNNEELDRNHK